jgi:hypothetical protein
LIPFLDVEHPEVEILQTFQQLAEGEAAYRAVKFPFCQYYLADRPVLSLLSMVQIENRAGQLSLGATVTEWSSVMQQSAEAIDPNEAAVLAWCQQHQLPWFELNKAIHLSPIAIAKPWGQEIWYTGIEERGQSQVSAQGFKIPLPWLMALAPQLLAQGQHQTINLLKILDPLPEEVYGDLYFELHEEKQEVYVVTHIDSQAWPQGAGGIRFGFNTDLRVNYKNDDAFKADYLRHVKAYESVRRAIDAAIDKKRQAAGIALDLPVSAQQQKSWLEQIPENLRRDELHKREAMEAFTAIKLLQLGEVVKVPCLTPHSLMHGVRTVEFQTPVYERKILAFAQKVLTQSHWDTESAVEILAVDTPAQPPLQNVYESTEVKVEQVVDFDDFSVLRVTLASGASYQLDQAMAYCLVMSLSENVVVSGVSLSTEGAVMVPSSLQVKVYNGANDGGAMVLISVPKQSSGISSNPISQAAAH